MTNYESGSNSAESPSDKSKKTTKEKPTDSTKRPLRVPFELPAADKPERATRMPFEMPKRAERPADDAKETSAESAATEAEPTKAEVENYAAPEIAKDHLSTMEGVGAETAEVLEPATEFLEKVANGADPEVAFSEVATEIGLTEDEIALALAEAPGEDETEADDEVQPTLAPEENVFDLDQDDAEIDLSTPAPGSPRAGSGTGGGGRGTTPPTPPSPPAPPTPPSSPPPPGPSPGSPAPGPASFNGMPLTASPNTLPPSANVYYSQRRRAGELLLVGIVAYLYGRHKGRIKTEKRLMPVQQKLERQVKQLEQDITHKEQQLVAAKAQRSERPATIRQEMPRPAIERIQPGRQETRLGMEKPVRAERLGRMIVTAEAPKTIDRVRMERPNSIREGFRAEEVKTMPRSDLLELSEKIVIEGASLRRIYESRLIGEKQLRHLVSEYLQGKDIRKDLRREMVEKEIDFERDPILRDRVRSHLSNNQGGSGLGDLLASVGIVEERADPVLQHRVEREEQRRTEHERRQHKQRAMADTAMATAIVVLAVLVSILVLTR